jgi:hypothetical protein
LNFKPNTNIKLNGNTIYVQGDIFMHPGIGMEGPGGVIAIGDVQFQPLMMSAEGAFVFVMSVTGMVDFQPLNDFYGSLAGNIEVNLQPNCALYAKEPPSGLGFPEITSLETVGYEIR